MKFVTRSLIVISVLFIASCATLNKNECLNADWEVIGYEDGTKGRVAARIGEHRKACSKHGISPDLSAYSKGRDKGLRIFCTPENGFKVGQRNVSYRDVCPRDMRKEFKAAFDYGKKIHATKREISKYQSDIEHSRNHIHDLEEEMSQNEALIIRGAHGPRERAQLVFRNREILDLISHEEDQISQAAYEIEHLQKVIHELTESSPYN